MIQRDQLEKAIDLLEKQRAELGDAVAETALAPLRAKLTALNQQVEGPLTVLRSKPGPVNVASMPPFDGERRVVTILFCDVKGSTTMAEKLDPEEWAYTIQRALEYLIVPVRRRDGMIAEVRGDGILAFFGAPLAHEDDPQRAVLAGLEIVENLRTFQEQLQHERGLDFNVRVGIHTGLVVVGEVSRRQPGEYAAFGDAVNLAARMEQTARPGSVQLTAETHRFVEQIFDFEPLGEIKVKGKSRSVQTYRVLGLKAEPAPQRGLAWKGLHSPLVGRETEFTIAKGSLERLSAGQGGILGIFGEAGIGKSRLIEEIHQNIPTDRFLWLEGYPPTENAPIAYWPFQEILRAYMGIDDQDSENQAWDKLVNEITSLFTENIPEILPYLASLLGLKVRGKYLERVKYLDGEALGKQIFLASRRFFERLAWTKPVVLIFEDLQWMDESSLGLLEHLLVLVEQLPLLIAILSRPVWEMPASHLIEMIEKDHTAHFTAIRLVSLSPNDSTQLVHNLLETESLPDDLRAMIVKRAEGNPFFLEEILRALIDLGAIQRETISGRWRATARMESLVIPNTVQSVVLARLDRLDEDVKRVLQVASVIGRSFLYRVLQAVTGAG